MRTEMNILSEHYHCKYEDRPPRCLDCKGPAWWNGARKVYEVHYEKSDLVHEVQIRRRAFCGSKDCPRGSWTVYEGDSYPHRGFSLEVVASVVSSEAAGDKTQETVAKEHGCSRRSVGRWVRWVECLAVAAELMSSCTRLSRAGLPGGTVVEHQAGLVLHLLDRLADLLSERGVCLPSFSCGLVRLLVDQLRRFGAVFYVTKSSPRLHADFGAVGL